MSLINEMLKDLDARERSRADQGAPSLMVYESGPSAKRESWLSTAAMVQAVLTLSLAGAFAWWVVQQQEQTALRAAQAAREAVENANVVTMAVAPQTVLQAVPLETPPVAPVLPEAPVATATPVVAAPVVAKPKSVVARAEVPKKMVLPAPAPAAQAKVAPAPPKVDQAKQAQLVYQQALEEKKKGAAEAASQLLRDALELDPQHAQARLALAQLLVERKQAPAAADLLADGLMLMPQHTGFMLAIAPLWIQAGQQNDAMALLAQGVKSADNDPGFHAYYAAQLLRLKRPAEAAAHYRVALRSDANKSEWLLGLGLALHGAGNLPEAVQALRRASQTGGLSAQNKTMVDQVIARLAPPPAS